MSNKLLKTYLREDDNVFIIAWNLLDVIDYNHMTNEEVITIINRVHRLKLDYTSKTHNGFNFETFYDNLKELTMPIADYITNIIKNAIYHLTIMCHPSMTYEIAILILSKKYPNLQNIHLSNFDKIKDNKIRALVEYTIKSGKYVSLNVKSLNKFEVEYEEYIKRPPTLLTDIIDKSDEEFIRIWNTWDTIDYTNITKEQYTKAIDNVYKFHLEYKNKKHINYKFFNICISFNELNYFYNTLGKNSSYIPYRYFNLGGYDISVMLLKKDYPKLSISDMKVVSIYVYCNKARKLIEYTIKTGKYIPLTDESLKTFEMEYEESIKSPTLLTDIIDKSDDEFIRIWNSWDTINYIQMKEKQYFETIDRIYRLQLDFKNKQHIHDSFRLINNINFNCLNYYLDITKTKLCYMEHRYFNLGYEIAKMILKKEYPALAISSLSDVIPKITQPKIRALVAYTIKTGKYVPLNDKSLNEFEVEYEESIKPPTLLKDIIDKQDDEFIRIWNSWDTIDYINMTEYKQYFEAIDKIYRLLLEYKNKKHINYVLFINCNINFNCLNYYLDITKAKNMLYGT